MKKTVAYVYYRTIPAMLNSFISKTPGLTLIKDGVKTGVGHSCPRLTILLDIDVEKEVIPKQTIIKQLVAILESLSANNQIVSYGILEKF